MVTEKESTEKETGQEDETAALRRANEALTREAEARTANVTRLEQTLAGKDAEITALKQILDEARQTLDGLGKALAKSVAAYKELIIQANPGLLAELITGDTIEAVDASLKQARALIERVRQEMEAEAARTRVPAGSPQRAPLDLSGLSAREKIQYAIGGSS
jgi:predicted RNase H-like nuclease (RuvC/YqgF family)